ncbi:MAG: hypothetical protein H3C50_05590 [Kiritimatiellae bacterium]|nr:hypothetical protein [Kiritimatiellia bacterium]MCO5069464.1 hypothetical protein [Kiritimatiellia bacterium]
MWPSCFVLFRRIFSLGLVLLLASSCVQVEQTLSLDATGGGKLVFGYTMTKEAFAEIEARVKAEAEASGEDATLPFSFDKAKIQEEFKEYAPLGIALEDVRAWDDDRNKHVRLEIRFASLAGVMKTEFFSDRTVELKKIDEGVYELRQRGAAGAESIPPETMDMMRSLLAGFRATLTFELPGAVVASNAGKTEDRRAEWVFDVDADTQALIRAQSEDLWVRFSAEGLELPEYPPR